MRSVSNYSKLPGRRAITDVTRRKVFDWIMISSPNWAGERDEPGFVSRLYDLSKMQSTDPRFTSAMRDIQQHRVNNLDWDDEWIFTDERFGLQYGPDEVLLAFLAEMLHPRVRPDEQQVAYMAQAFNEALGRDGYELYVAERLSGHGIYKWRRLDSFHGDSPDLRLDERSVLTNPVVLQENLSRIRTTMVADPAVAISACKDLLESLLRTILDDNAISYGNGDDLLKLYNKVATLLRLDANAIPDNVKASETVRLILRTLATTVRGLGELRNELGLGHGKTKQNPALVRHAKLALNSTVTVTEFLLDTWEVRVAAGDIQATDEPR